MNLVSATQEMLHLLDQCEQLKQEHEELLQAVQHAKEPTPAILHNKPLAVHQEDFKLKMIDLFHELASVNERIQTEYAPTQITQPITQAAQPTAVAKPIPVIKRKTLAPLPLSKRGRKHYLESIRTDRQRLRELRYRSAKKTQPTLLLHHANAYARFANIFFGSFSTHSRQKHWYKHLHDLLGAASIPLLTASYVSCMILSTLLAGIVGSLITLGILAVMETQLPVMISGAAGSGLLLALITFLVFSFYPSMKISQRNRKIKSEIPFATIHLAAIASSGARPASLFKLLLNSHEYPGIEPELRRMVNMLNLFGYDITTAVKAVAATTPSKPFRDLLGGIASTIESGGSVKDYLTSMASDSLSTYKLERRKFGETIATYSDIYTGILIAAPLLFVVALAIINILGGSIGGVPLQTAALVGTYGIIPFLNVAFYIFLSVMYPEG